MRSGSEYAAGIAETLFRAVRTLVTSAVDKASELVSAEREDVGLLVG